MLENLLIIADSSLPPTFNLGGYMDTKPIQDLVFNIAALLYYDDGNKQSFEKQTEDVQKAYLEKSAKFLVILDKLGKQAGPKINEKEVEEKRARHIEILTDIIRNFVSGLKTTKPAHFPHEELAHRILEGK